MFVPDTCLLCLLIKGAFFGLIFDCKGMKIENWSLVNQCALLQQRIFLSKRNLNLPKAAPESSSFLPAVSPQAMPLNRIDPVLSCAIHALKLSS